MNFIDEKRNTSIDAVRGGNGAGEARQWLSCGESMNASKKCSLGQALWARDECWRNTA